jgi:hypothetical protein
MPPVTFPYRASVIRRSLWVNAAFVALGLFYFAVARPLKWTWVDVAMLVGLVFYGTRCIYDAVRLMRPIPAVIIDDDGLRDPALGNLLIPWAAIKEIRVDRMRGLSQLFLIAESERLSASPGGAALKFVNWIRGARAGRKSTDMALPMSPSVALEAGMDEILATIRARPQCTYIQISDSHPGATGI